MMQKNILILIGAISLSYIIIFLLAPKDIIDYTIADVSYWRETENRLLVKTMYDYNDKYSVASFPKTLGEWKGFDYRYPDFVYKQLDTDILMSRGYRKDDNNKNIIWMDIINSKTGESFHTQKLCVKGAGWNIDNESIIKFDIANSPNPFRKLYVNRLDLSKGNKRQIMLYWFMFKKFGFNDSVAMIRLSAPVRNNDTTMTFNYVKNFVETQLFDTMYKSKQMEDITNAEYLVSEYGNIGKIAIILGMLIPLGMIFTGIKQKIQKIQKIR